jgi:hypothetical protein
VKLITENGYRIKFWGPTCGHLKQQKLIIESTVILFGVGFEVFTGVVMRCTSTQRTTRRHIPEDDTLQNLYGAVNARGNTVQWV